MLWDKGVAEFVSCATTLKGSGLRARFALVGEPDFHNPECVPESQLRQWSDSGIVEWWGRRDDMPEVFSQAHIVCLPTSYGEGLPKVLLEAASCARPIVTFDVPACREIVTNEENGFLVPSRDVRRLGEAIAALVDDPVLRKNMGALGRRRVLREFSQEHVAAQTLSVWKELLH
jgi:glycosyltransferase involved in cell wall biosynthesis